jgi:hypothetical protein
LLKPFQASLDSLLACLMRSQRQQTCHQNVCTPTSQCEASPIRCYIYVCVYIYIWYSWISHAYDELPADNGAASMYHWIVVYVLVRRQSHWVNILTDTWVLLEDSRKFKKFGCMCMCFVSKQYHRDNHLNSYLSAPRRFKELQEILCGNHPMPWCVCMCFCA